MTFGSIQRPDEEAYKSDKIKKKSTKFQNHTKILILQSLFTIENTRIFLPKMVSLNEGNNFLSCMSVKMSLLVTELAFPRKWLLIDSTFHSTRRCKSSSSRPIFSGNSIYMWRSAKKSFSTKMNHNLSRLWFSLIFSGQFYGISQKRLKST